MEYDLKFLQHERQPYSSVYNMNVHLNKKYHNFKVFFTKWKMTLTFQHHGRRPSLFNTMEDNLKFQQMGRRPEFVNKTEDNLNFSTTWVTTSKLSKFEDDIKF